MLEQRALQEELMDAPDLDPASYAALLSDLAKVTTVTMGRRPTLGFLDRVVASSSKHTNSSFPRRRESIGTAGSNPDLQVSMDSRLRGSDEQGMGLVKSHEPVEPTQTLRILDVGYGHGDMLRRINVWARKRGIKAELTGIDLNPKSADVARAASAGHDIDFQTGDYALLAGQGFDVILSSLVAHHMTHDQLIAFLRFMEREAQRGWFVNDLHRHGFAYAGYPLLGAIMRWHPIVRHDGRLSIARSYRPEEWPAILEEAGVARARVFRAFPFRLCVEQIR